MVAQYFDLKALKARIQQYRTDFDIHRRFLLFEDAVLLLAPGFIVWSLRKYLPATFFYAFGGLLPVVLAAAGFYGKNLKRVLLTYVFGAACLAFIVGIWEIYDVGWMFQNDDTKQYRTALKYDPENPDFWMNKWGKPPVTLLIFKFFQLDFGAINVCFIGLYLVAALAFMVSMMPFFQTWREKLLAGALFLPFFLNQHDMSLWVACALSETPSIATALLVVGLCGVSYTYREHLHYRPWLSYLVIAAVLSVAVVFAFVRDTNAYFLPCVAVFYWGVFKKFRQRLLIVCGLLVLFVVATKTAEYSGRWKWLLNNVLSERILPDERLRGIFQRDYHLPEDRVVMSCAHVWYQKDCPGRQAIKGWLSTYGFHAYQHFLITHPRYTWGEWLKKWEVLQGNLWSLAEKPTFYAYERVRSKHLNALIFNFPGLISLPTAIVVGLFGLMFVRRNPLILLCMAYAVLVGVIAYHGDHQEVVRHAQQPMMMLKIAFLLSGLHIYTLLKARSLNFNTSDSFYFTPLTPPASGGKPRWWRRHPLSPR